MVLIGCATASAHERDHHAPTNSAVAPMPPCVGAASCPTRRERRALRPRPERSRSGFSPRSALLTNELPDLRRTHVDYQSQGIGPRCDPHSIGQEQRNAHRSRHRRSFRLRWARKRRDLGLFVPWVEPMVGVAMSLLPMSLRPLLVFVNWMGVTIVRNR